MNRKGFTLVETMVAMVILAVGLLAIAKMNITYVRSNTATQYISQAAVLAQEKMEQLRAYATSERADNWSVFDFNYLVSEDPCFTSITDPPIAAGTLKTVSGLLSGGQAGACGAAADLVTTNGVTYEVMYDDAHQFFAASGAVPVFKDAAANDGVWTGADRIYLDTITAGGSGFFITRLWTVEPMTSGTRINFARLTVESHWTDQYDKSRSIRLQSLVHQRQ